MNENLAHRYSSESTLRELSNEHQYDGFRRFSKIFLCFLALDISNLTIGRVQYLNTIFINTARVSKKPNFVKFRTISFLLNFAKI